MLTTSCRKNPKTGRIEMTILLDLPEDAVDWDRGKIMGFWVKEGQTTGVLQICEHLSSLRTLHGKEKK
jgi:hypothetical protein